MSTRPSLVCVTGSRALADHADARAWLRAELDRLAPAVVVTGDARGPDRWAGQWAQEHGASLRSYALSGGINDGSRSCGTWTKASPPAALDPKVLWAAWCLHRDRVMVQHVAKRAGDYDVTVVALRSKHSKTHGTGFTVDRAKAKHLAVKEETWA